MSGWDISRIVRFSLLDAPLSITTLHEKLCYRRLLLPELAV